MKYFIDKFKTLLRLIVLRCISIFYNTFYPMDDKQVLFLSEVRNVMGGNLKSIYDYLEGKDYRRVIQFRGDRRERRGIKKVIKLIKLMSTSRYILLEDYVSIMNYTKRRHGQDIVQLWHGPGAYKRFGWSRKKTGERVGNIHRGYKQYTKATVSGEGIRWCYAEAFGIDESKVKATGFPRTDELFDETYLKKVKDNFFEEYPEMKGKKTILFAPTYRGNHVHKANYGFDTLNIDELYEKLHDEYNFIIKWHPALYNNIERGLVKTPDFSKYPNFFYDLSSYRDINDILIACDILVTDYSSTIFDYLLLNKPIVYYTYDLDDYTGQGGRGLYFDFNEYVYGSVAANQEELIEAIKKNDMMQDKREVFFNKFMNACDGNSTKKTAEWIFDKE